MKKPLDFQNEVGRLFNKEKEKEYDPF